MSLPDPVSMTVHNVAAPSLQADDPAARQRQTRMGRIKMLLVLLVCASPVIASYLTYFVIRPQSRTNYGELIQPSKRLPALVLRSLDGPVHDLNHLRGQWLLVAVGPSQCVDGCAKLLFLQRQLREMLGRERTRIDKVWFVTDAGTPPPDILAIVQGVAPPLALRADRQALLQWLAPAPGQALEDHLYVVDPMGEWMMRLPTNPEPARAKRDLDRLLRASSFWDKAGR